MKLATLALICVATLGFSRPVSALVTNGYSDLEATPPNLTLRGFDFGPVQGQGLVVLIIDGVITPLNNIVSWSDNEIVADVSNQVPLAPGSYLTAVIPDGGFFQPFYLAIQGNQGLPAGAIVMWSGSIATIPSGWLLCDGTNGTPDLRDRFVVGASVDNLGVAATTVEGPATQAGGATLHEHGGATADHSLTIDEIPSHIHHFARNASSGPSANGFLLQDFPTTALFGTTAEGGGEAHAHAVSESPNVPPYYALAFIVKQ